MLTSTQSGELVPPDECEGGDVFLLHATVDQLALNDAGIRVTDYAKALRVLYDGTGHLTTADLPHCNHDAAHNIMRYLDLHEEVYVDYDDLEAWHLPHVALQLCRIYRVHPRNAWACRDAWEDIRRALLPGLDGSLRGTELKAHLAEFEEDWQKKQLPPPLIRLFTALTIIESAMEESVSAVRYDLSKAREHEKEAERHATH